MAITSIDLANPTITDTLPGIGGRLRSKPEHFEVREIPLYEPCGVGEHLYVNVTKVNQTTKEIQDSLGRLFGVKKNDIGIAGLKDKFARTTQTFSVHVGYQTEEYTAEAKKRLEDQLDAEVNWTSLHRNKLKTGHLLGNEFAITVTELDADPETMVQRCEAIAEVIRQRGIPNYFGPQRFGRDGQNVEQGLAILSGSSTRQDKWLRKFLVGSVQSYLCNQYLAERLRTDQFDRLLTGDVAKKYETGGMFVVDDASVEQPRHDAHEISFTAPLFGPKMRNSEGASAEFEHGVLARSGLTNEDFKRQRVSGTRRLGRLLVDELGIEVVDDGVRLRFALPKGAYATTVLREFMKNDAPSQALDDDEDSG